MRCYAYRRSPVALVALGARALAVCCGVAHAQTPPPISEDAIVEVVVTGSRIPIANDVAISPVTEVSSAIIEQTGVTRIEDLLNSLPQVFADQGSTVSNGADGTQRSICAASAQDALSSSLTAAGSDPVIPRAVVSRT